MLSATNQYIVNKNFTREEKEMRYFLLFIVLFAISFGPTALFAGEDVDEFIFDGDTFDTGPEETKTEDVKEEKEIKEISIEDMQNNSIDSDKADGAGEPQNELMSEIKTEVKPSSYSEDEITKKQNVSEQGLTDVIKNDEQAQKPRIPLLDKDKTWVGKLMNQQKSDVAQDEATLETMVESAKNMSKNASNRSNVSVYDISGVMLRMGLKQVDSTMKNRGFKKVMEKYQIPNFIKWRNEEFCRNSGVVGYERIEACIAQKAKKDKHQYVQETKYIKYDTKEEISVFFTSNFTDNKVCKIIYKSQAANIAGNSPKSVYLRNIKIYDFWKKINQKYGSPDDKENVTWGLGENKPFMKASTGYLMMEDPMLKELDYTRMSREDQRYMNTDLYSF